MSNKGPAWDQQRSERLRSTLSDADIEALKARAEAAPGSLTLDEVGVLFLVTRDRIRVIEAKAKRNKGDGSGK